MKNILIHKLELFLPNNTAVDRKASFDVKDRLIHYYGGYTTLIGGGEWVDYSQTRHSDNILCLVSYSSRLIDPDSWEKILRILYPNEKAFLVVVDGIGYLYEEDEEHVRPSQ